MHGVISRLRKDLGQGTWQIEYIVYYTLIIIEGPGVIKKMKNEVNRSTTDALFLIRVQYKTFQRPTNNSTPPEADYHGVMFILFTR